jgi:hypothetical protein
MPAETVTADQPKHPLYALTTYELRDYRRDLEHVIEATSADAPAQADLRRKLAEVLGEQESRAEITATPGTHG